MPSFNEKEFRAQEDLRTIIESKKIMKDPKRKKAAMAEAKKQKAALSAVTQSK